MGLSAVLDLVGFGMVWHLTYNAPPGQTSIVMQLNAPAPVLHVAVERGGLGVALMPHCHHLLATPLTTSWQLPMESCVLSQPFFVLGSFTILYSYGKGRLESARKSAAASWGAQPP
jgi:hypothetical protein